MSADSQQQASASSVPVSAADIHCAIDDFARLLRTGQRGSMATSQICEFALNRPASKLRCGTEESTFIVLQRIAIE